jgi:predicted AAA+ superfamily ATPase
MDAIFLGQARAQARRADDWADYARDLEARLAHAEASLKAVTTVKDVALAELAKLDPRNYLLVQKNRQAIADAAFNGTLAGRKAS